MKLYDLTKELLEKDAELRNSDKKLIWAVWTELGYVKGGFLSFDSFTDNRCPIPESIRRCRQKIQELNPELQATEGVQRKRKMIEKERGTHIFREKVEPKGRYVETSPGTLTFVPDATIEEAKPEAKQESLI